MDAVFGVPNNFCSITDSLTELLLAGKWRKARERLREMGKIPQWEACNCLLAAMRHSDALFRDVLAACPPGEYSAQYWLSYPGVPEDTPNVELFGTLPILAAANGEREKLRLLLEKGMDCNAASLTAYETMQLQWPNRLGFPSYVFDFNGRKEALCRRQRITGGCGAAEAGLPPMQGLGSEKEGTIISGMTPLAAAILFGRIACVRLLLREPGVRVRESSAVGVAALLAARGTPEQRACARLAFGLPEDADVTEALVGGTLLPAENVALFGTPQELRRRLGCPGATEAEARALLENDALWEHAGRSKLMTQKLLSVFAAFPSLLREDAARDLLLCSGLDGLNATELLPMGGKDVLAPPDNTCPELLLKLWRRDAPAERDVSAGLRIMGRSLTGPSLRQALETLAEGGELVASADAVLGCWPVTDLYMLLRKVRFYRNTDKGISALACSILLSMSQRLLRCAVRTGVLAGEDRAAMLRFAQILKLPAPLRAAILTLPPQKAETCPSRETVLWQYRSCMGKTEEAALREAFRCALFSPEPEQDCRELLEALRHDCSLNGNPGDGPEIVTPDGRLRLYSYYAAALCGSDKALLRLARERPEQETVMAELSDESTLNCSPLCLAAAAGSCASIRVLLDEGADADENDRARRSEYKLPRKSMMLVTPLAMALLLDRPEAAALLEQAGADRALAEACCARLRAQRTQDQGEEGA